LNPSLLMIKNLSCNETEKLFNSKFSKKLPFSYKVLEVKDLAPAISNWFVALYLLALK